MCLAFAEKKGLTIMKDPLHPARHLFTPLPSGRRLRAIKSKFTRFLDSPYCRIVHALNYSGIYTSAFHSGHICIVEFMYVYVFMYVFSVRNVSLLMSSPSKFQTTRVFGNK